jgi:hypothetical protein
MGDVLLISTADAVWGSHAFQHNFKLFAKQRWALCRKILLSIESPDAHSLLVAIIPLSHWSALNTPKTSCVPTARNPRDLGQWDRAGQLTGSPHPTRCSPKVWLMCCQAGRRKWGDATSGISHMCCRWRRGIYSKIMVKHSPKNDGRTHLLVF